MWSFLFACGGVPAIDPAPQTQPAAAMAAAGGVPVWRALFALEDGHFELPGDNLPATGMAPEEYALGGPWKQTGKIAAIQVWNHPMPFRVTAPRPGYAPFGARLFELPDRKEIPYVNDSGDIRGSGWLVERGNLRLLSPTDPNGRQLILISDELGKSDKRLAFSRSGMSAVEFVQTQVTVDGESRLGLLVPAPGRASWSLTLPSGGVLDFGVALLDPQTPGETSDGAGVSVWVDEQRIWSSRVVPGQDFEDVRIDLTPYAGKSVVLSFRSEPGGTLVRDHVVFTNPTLSASTDPAPRHVILVGIDTHRYDALSLNGYPLKTSEALDSWATNAVVFDDALAPAPRTRPSFRTSVTGKYPLTAVHAPVIAEYFARAGFRTAGFTANIHLVPRFGFNSGFEQWEYENGAPAHVEIGRAMSWMRQHQDEDFFVFLHLMDPHTFYNAPGSYEYRFTKGSRPKNVPALFNRWEVITRMGRGQIGPTEQAWIRGKYDGEIAYVSDQLTAFLVEAEKMSTRTISAIISDHGEEFWDHGGYEHNHSLYQELVHVLLMIRPQGGWGGGPHRSPAPVGLVDVMPTLLDLAGLGVPEGLDGVSLRPFVDAAQNDKVPELTAFLEDRPRVLGHMMFNLETWGVVYRGWKYTLETISGKEELYDLKADPQEKKNRVGDISADPAGIAAQKLAELRMALARGLGWPVVPALRARIAIYALSDFELVFESPILEAGVIDPEANRTTRANLEWGEQPPVRPEDVASVVVSEDRLRVMVKPGPQANTGVLYVACEGECPLGRLRLTNQDSIEAVLTEKVRVGGISLDIEPGRMVLQRFTEAEALADPVGAGQIEALKELGYLED